MAIYVMSDIQGCYDAFINMLDKIHYNIDDGLILLGNYIGLGNQNIDMIDWIVTNKTNKRIIFLRGSNEQDFISDVLLLEESCYSINLLENYLYLRDTHIDYDKNNIIFNLIFRHGYTLNRLKEISNMFKYTVYSYQRRLGAERYMFVHSGYTDNIDKLRYSSKYDFYLYANEDSYTYGGYRNGIVVAGHNSTADKKSIFFNEGKVLIKEKPEEECIYYYINCGGCQKKRNRYSRFGCIELGSNKEYYICK